MIQAWKHLMASGTQIVEQMVGKQIPLVYPLALLISSSFAFSFGVGLGRPDFQITAGFVGGIAAATLVWNHTLGRAHENHPPAIDWGEATICLLSSGLTG